MEELHNWLFNYNPHRAAWFAFKRDHMVEYFNGDHENVIKSKSQKTLEELIVAHDGDLKKINKFIASIK